MMPACPGSVTALLLIAGVLATTGCGDDASPSTAAVPASTTAPAAASTAARGSSCPDVPVPGHRATDVRATGVSCATAVTVANDAEGRGRAAYSSSGLSCTPSDAPAGDTDYACTAGERRLTFRYGAA